MAAHDNSHHGEATLILAARRSRKPARARAFQKTKHSQNVLLLQLHGTLSLRAQSPAARRKEALARNLHISRTFVGFI
jgi:hypothetical protein